MAESKTHEISDLLQEHRSFPPAESFRTLANVRDSGVYERAERDPEGFWAGFASELEWMSPWTQVLEWKPPHAKWFVGGTLNASVNCVDRHIRTARRNKAALIWEGEPGDRRTLTYFDLYRQVSQFANVLKNLGVKRGDRVAIYLPLIPELPIAMLACARIGAIHSVVFGGFSSDSLRDRINDSECTLLITADGGWRRGQVVPLKQMADEALKDTPSIRNVVIVQRLHGSPVPVHVEEGRDHWYHRLMQDAPNVCEPEAMDAEDMLYILYTSGTTGKPKGIVHATGGSLVGTYATTKWVFDLKEEDVYWCTADIGWVTGHSYVVYGPLANGATVVMYEGSPDWPDKGRFWQIVEELGVTIFYTAPTAIRAFMKWGEEWPRKRKLTSLRLLGSVGEPINPEAWVWYHENIGGGSCPVVDTWWQTETGGIMISPLPGATTLKPGSATFPLPGITAEVVDDTGNKIERGGGYLTLTRPWPGMLRGIWGDPQRYVDTYWSRFEGRYFAGDGCKLDDEGYLWLLGRVDDVMNVSGHRISTTEVESALVSHPAVAEAAVVGARDEMTGQAIISYVALRGGSDPGVRDLRNHVATEIGAIAKPKTIYLTPDLPKTRSGKIMRRLLRDVAEGRNLGDTTTLADASVVGELQRRAAEVSSED